MILLFRTSQGFQEAENNPINHSLLPTSTPDQTAQVCFVWKSGRDPEIWRRPDTCQDACIPSEPWGNLRFGPGLPHLEGKRRRRWVKIWPVCTRPTSLQISECENEVSSLLLALMKISPQLCVLFLPAVFLGCI